jgi:hypothetical protein
MLLLAALPAVSRYHHFLSLLAHRYRTHLNCDWPRALIVAINPDNAH